MYAALGLLPNIYFLAQAAVILLAAMAVTGFLALLLSPIWVRVLVNRSIDHVVRRLFSEPYTKNLTEGLAALRKFTVQATLENELRSSTGQALEKPIGTARPFPNFDGLVFSPAPLDRGANDKAIPVALETVLGRSAARPLRISSPVMIAAMGYGVALKKPFARALAKGASLAGTAYNAGQGPVLPEFRALAEHLILQYHSAPWRAPGDLLETADMIEVRLGQGANAGCGTVVSTRGMAPQTLQDFDEGFNESAELYIPAGIRGVKTARQLRRLVLELRALGKGCPVAVKLAASHSLEHDLGIVLEAEADVVVIDGAQGGTHASPAILVDDFGIPTLHALCRATRFLRQQGAAGRVNLVVSGGIRTPGDMLKAVALGADAVYIGTAALFAATHLQITKAIPFEPPTQVAWENSGTLSVFDEDAGAASLARFLTSCAEEMRDGIRALGKSSLAEVNERDLVAWDVEAARITGLDLC